MRKISLIFVSIILVLGFVYFFNNLEKTEPAKASPGPGHNVYGWAWAGGGEISGNATATIGWISFNCYNDYNGDGVLESHCTDAGYTSNYGVNIDPSTGLFSGYAWAGGGKTADGSATATIGWISFSTSSLVGCPSGICEARLENNQISGWARVCSVFETGCSGATSTNTGDWDGWIKLRGTTTDGTPYGVSLNPTTREFEDWAAGWDDSTSTAVIGWISFNCKNRDWCATSSYKVKTSLILPPVVSNPTSSFEGACYQSRIPKLSWQVNTDQDYDYTIEIATTSNFSSPIVTVNVSSTQSTSWVPPLPCVGCCDVSLYEEIKFGKNTYYWRVKVAKDGKKSNWATSTFETLLHCYPAPDFTPSPRTGTVGQVITFNNNSKCYGSSCTYYWDFGNGKELTQPTTTNATTTYDKTGKKTVKLRITDKDLNNAYCETTREVIIQARLPWWKEILPF